MYKNYVIYINTFLQKCFLLLIKCVYENFSVKNMKW